MATAPKKKPVAKAKTPIGSKTGAMGLGKKAPIGANAAKTATPTGRAKTAK